MKSRDETKVNEWYDATTYSRDDNDRISSIWKLKIGKISIVVHRHIHFSKDAWLLSCDLFYNNYELRNKDIRRAKREAIRMIKADLAFSLSQLERRK